ncbi:hypothetical protein Scep_018813 [Stephania cephalantha]|uniref:Uncharacterized protein n=1 Tax=Stephania cephalantha TaxID=152367 RepID=A0AAP0NM89_9MAGN
MKRRSYGKARKRDRTAIPRRRWRDAERRQKRQCGVAVIAQAAHASRDERWLRGGDSDKRRSAAPAHRHGEWRGRPASQQQRAVWRAAAAREREDRPADAEVLSSSAEDPAAQQPRGATAARGKKAAAAAAGAAAAKGWHGSGSERCDAVKSAVARCRAVDPRRGSATSSATSARARRHGQIRRLRGSASSGPRLFKLFFFLSRSRSAPASAA